MSKAKPDGIIRDLFPIRTAMFTRRHAGLGALALAALMLTAGLALWAAWSSGPVAAQAQDDDAPAVDNLRCIAETDRVAFLWDAPEWSGGEATAYDYRLTLPDGRKEGMRLSGFTLVYKPGSYQSGKETRFSIRTVYDTVGGGQVVGAEAELVCYVGGEPEQETPTPTPTPTPPPAPNRAPTVSSPLADATIVNESGTQSVSLSGVFDDADSDALTVTATSSDATVATVSVASDQSSLTLTAKARGTATITVTADDGQGGTVEDAFTVTVKAAPTVASALADISGMEVNATQDVSLSGVFSDADGDTLTVTATSSDAAVATSSVASDQSRLTVAGVAEGTATITVTARDSDGNRVNDAFDVSVATAPQPQTPQQPRLQMQDTDYDSDDDGLIEVSSLAQLNAIRWDVDGNGSSTDDGYSEAFSNATSSMGCPTTGCKGYELAADLDFDTNGSGSADSGDDYWNHGNGWLPIGEYAAVFDGNGHAISNLYINAPGRRGLFQEIAETGVIRNVTLKNVNVSGSGNLKGGLAGINRGTVSNVGVTGSVSGSSGVGGLVGANTAVRHYKGTITDSHSYGEVSGTGNRVGGLVGQNAGGRIVRSYSTANVTATGARGSDYYGGLVGYSVYYRSLDGRAIQASILGSYATGRVSGNADVMGGLVGYNGGEIFAGYATGDVSGTINVGGLVGHNAGPISASFALGAVSGEGRVGGLVGRHDGVTVYATINGHRCLGCSLPNVKPGQVDIRSDITASYWNIQAPGQTATQATHLGLSFAFHPRDAGQTIAELSQPTDYTGIYAHWDNLRDNSGDSYAWDFGTSLDFPALRDTGPSVAAQWARMPDPPANAELPPTNRPEGSGIDYDRDDDGLIEVWSLAQLHEIRYDMIGTGAYGWDHDDWPNSARDSYQTAYPGAMPGMGCPHDRCLGYELMTDLDFDTNRNGEIDPGDHYWNGVHHPDDSEFCIDWYRSHPQASVRETPGACDDYWGNVSEGWRPLGRNLVEKWQGVFEGNGHTIRNLYVNTLDPPSGHATGVGAGGHNYAGLFREIDEHGVVRNLKLENVSVSGKITVGAVAGQSNGIIRNVHVTGAVSGIRNVGGLVGLAEPGNYIAGSSSRAGVAGKRTGGKDVGGLVGLNQGEIQASYVRGAVSGWADNTGGLVGRNEEGGSIKSSYATGPVSSAGQRAGGLVGDNVGSVTASYATGSASADRGEAGGLVGRQGAGAVTAAYWDTQASGITTSPAGAGKTTAELKTPTGYTGIYAGWNVDMDADGSGDDPWDFGTASQYPALKYGGLSPTAQRAPAVSSSLSDVTLASGGGTQTVSLTGLFSDPDDSLTITATSSDAAVATVSVTADYSKLTLTGIAVGTTTITVAAHDSDGNSVSDTFDVTVVRKLESTSQQRLERPLLERCASYLPSNALSVSEVEGWRDEHPSNAAHVLRWNEVLAALGADVPAGVTAMTVAESRANERRWTPARWVRVTATLEALDTCRAAAQDPPNQAPTVSSSISDITIVNESGTRTVSLSGVFDDADNDALTVTATSSNESVATVSVAADRSSLTVSAQARGTATITVSADDGNGGTVSDAFTVRVKAAPVVSSALADVSALEVDATQDVSLSGVFDDADNDALTVTATSSDATVAAVSVSSDYSKLTLSGVAVGTTTITVIAQDSDGNSVSDAFDVTVVRKLESASQQSSDGSLLERCASHLPSNALSVSEVEGWRDEHPSNTAHVLRWNEVLAALGADVPAGVTAMTVAESRANERRWTPARWVRVTATLEALDTCRAAAQDPPNQAPTVASVLGDVTIVNESGTRTVSLSGVFDDADNDALTVTAGSSNEAVATVSVASNGSSLTVTAQARGTATITVSADDGNGGTVSDAFTVRVKAAPVVSSALSDVSGLEAGAMRDVSLSGVFSDADNDALTITAGSSNDSVATVSVSSGGSTLTVEGVSQGAATITVTARDSDGNRISDSFAVSVVNAPEPDPTPTPTPTPDPEPSTLSGAAARYDANGDGKIDVSEYRRAVTDYVARKITYSELLEVIRAYMASG